MRIIKDEGHNAGYWLMYNAAQERLSNVRNQMLNGLPVTYGSTALVAEAKHFSLWLEFLTWQNLNLNAEHLTMVPCYDDEIHFEFALKIRDAVDLFKCMDEEL